MVNTIHFIATTSIFILTYTILKKYNIIEKFTTESELSILIDTITKQTEELQNRIIKTNENMEILRSSVQKNYTMNPEC